MVEIKQSKELTELELHVPPYIDKKPWEIPLSQQPKARLSKAPRKMQRHLESHQ